MLSDAMTLSRNEPDTMGHRAAWGWLEEALDALKAFTDERDVVLSDAIGLRKRLLG